MKITSKFNISFLCLIMFVLITSCTKEVEEPQEEPTTSDCIFIQNDDDNDGLVDETEQSIIQNCLDNRLSDISEIKSNLIGEWNIVGHGEGWVPSLSQPCGKVIFTESAFTFDFESYYIDSLYTGNWDVITTENGNILLEVIDVSVYPLSISTFSDSYMFFNHMESDGSLFIYEKK